MQEYKNNLWEHFPHGSDIGIRGRGKNVSEAFAMATMALTALMGVLQKVLAQETLQFAITSESLDFLFYDWLNRLIYESAAHYLLFAQFQIHVTAAPWWQYGNWFLCSKGHSRK